MSYPGMVTGIHHPSLGTKDYPKILNFYTRVMGLKLVGWYLMHGSKNAYHALFSYSDERNSGFLSFSNKPEIDALSPVTGLTTAVSINTPLAAGSAQFYGFGVASETCLERAFRQISASGCSPSAITDKGYCRMFSFKGPENVNLVISLDAESDGDGQWIDMSLIDELGFSQADIATFRQPKLRRPTGRVPNPTFDKSTYSFHPGFAGGAAKHFSNATLTFLMSDDNGPAKGRTMRSTWLDLRKFFAVVPRIVVLKLTGKL